MSTTMKVVIGGLLAFILIASGFAGGFAVERVVNERAALTPVAAALDAGNLGAKVQEAQNLINDQALSPPNETSATAGAIQGLITANGDRWAQYFDAKQLKAWDENFAGSFGGIGVVLGETSGTATILEVYKGTPAEKAGVKKGDVFRTINKKTQSKWTSDEVVKLVRGPAGTNVTITFVRPSTSTSYTATITRAQIKVPNTESKMYGTVGYIRLFEFNEQSAADITKAMDELKKKGARAFVLDLRDNPGGLLQQAVAVSSLFVPQGVVVKVDERNKPEQVYNVTGGTVTNAPLVVLINENSASASEITGGALQDHGRAKLVGMKSFGKGSVQTVSPLSFGGAIKFTIAHYLTPNGHTINNIGLHPDYVVPMPLTKQGDLKTDLQLQEALKVVRQQIK